MARKLPIGPLALTVCIVAAAAVFMWKRKLASKGNIPTTSALGEVGGDSEETNFMPTIVVLDTCAVRAHLYGDYELPIDELEEKKAEFSFTIPDTAISELIVQLCEDRLSSEVWRNGVASLGRILDPNQPILPGNRELGYMAGLTDTAPDYGNEPDTLTLYKGLWDKLTSIKSKEDIAQGFDVVDAQGVTRHIGMSCEQSQAVVTAEREEWIKWIEEIQKMLGGQGVKKTQIEELVTKGLAGLLGASPEKEEKVHAMSAMLIRYADLALASKEPLNPRSEKRRGDYFDFSMLLSLALPNAIFCTRDKKFQQAVRSTGTPQGDRVILTEELLTRLNDGSLSEIVQPSS